MAEIVVSAAVNVLIEKLFSGDLMKLARFEGIASQQEKLKTTWGYIVAVLADASEKHITQESVKMWLLDLHHLAYDIEDVLDDMATEIMRRKFNDELHGSTSTGKVLKKIIPTCCTNFTPHNLMYGRKIRSMLDQITVKLNCLDKNKNILGLADVKVIVETKSNRNNRRLEQTSLIDESTVFGREVDQEALLSKLLGDEACNQNVSIISIFGLGGIGKTTLAQLLYNNQKVKNQFELRVWVCVSDEFDVLTISKTIYKAVAGEDKEFDNLDELHVALKEKLSNKRFLLVLDDVWNEDQEKWEILEKPLKGAPGSKIIVTTRKTMVASVMNCADTYALGILSEHDALSLLAKSALDEYNFDKHPSLISVARLIIEKCKGLPLALIAIGRVLKGKRNDEYEWDKLMKSEIWSSDNRILPALKLSYYDLPSQLKQLFAYCCLFPKDYVFNKNELVLLWMAEGFLNQPNGNMSMESVGCEYFEELQSRSFFQHSRSNESEYTMDDLMNDLAISVAGEFFFMLDDKMDVNGRNEAFEKFRHFSFLGQRGAKYGKLKELHRSGRLRTFLLVSVGWKDFDTLDNVLVDVLPKLQFLRVLSLTRRSITEVPQSIGGLKHLRYLNFSRTDIKQVPEEVSELYNLQSLLVGDCYDLVSLPVSFVKLINLRHLDMSGTPLLNKTPLGVGGLTCLQTLSKVIIEGANGFKVSDLKGLLNLEGQLSIKGLEKVTDPQQANDANLQEKKGLVKLDMEWSDVFDDSRNSKIEDEVIEGLRPHSKLNKLKILCYGGMKFPSWLGDPSFDKLTKLTIENCPKLAEVSIGLIPSLEVLILKSCSNCKKLVSMEEKQVNVGTSNVKSVLRKVTLECCDSLESYNCPNTVEVLEITGCSSMTSLTFSTTLQELPSSLNPYYRYYRNLVSVGEKEVNVGSSNMKSVLREVILSDCDSLESCNFPNSVEKLKINRCDSMTSFTFPTLQELPSSLNLPVRNCRNLVSVGEEEEVNVGSSNMKSVLREVTLSNCDSLESYNCPNTVKSLEISECRNLVSVEEKEVNVGSSNMKYVLREVYYYYVCGEVTRTLFRCDSIESYNCPKTVEILNIIGCSSMTSLTFSTTLPELPSSLKKLVLMYCKNLKSFPHEHLQSLTSLEQMKIIKCESMDDSFPCGLWPPKLRKLIIGELKKPMSEWGRQNYPTSLVELWLDGENSGVTSFAMEGDATSTASTSFLLPPSLTDLKISGFKDVESISNVDLQLEQLDIYSCPKIKDVSQSVDALDFDVDDDHVHGGCCIQ